MVIRTKLKLAPEAGLEPATGGLTVTYSYQLSYTGIKKQDAFLLSFYSQKIETDAFIIMNLFSNVAVDASEKFGWGRVLASKRVLISDCHYAELFYR